MTGADAASLCSFIVLAGLFTFFAIVLGSQLVAFAIYLGETRPVRRALDARTSARTNRAFEAIVTTYHREQ